MWLIDANKLMELCHNNIDGTVDCNDIARFPTVQAVPIKALYELKSEVEKLISQPKGYIKEVYEMGKDNAYENVLELIAMKILEYGSDTE